jgi:uncharacterized protein YegL
MNQANNGHQNQKQRVLVNFVLDRSGSMSAVLGDTIGGFNAYVQGLRDEQEVDYLFSLTLFNTTCENRHVAEPIGKIAELDNKSYVPDGWTALYDAIGLTVRAVEKKFPAVDKVMTVIMTDGHENSSREWTQQGIKDLIAAKEKEGNWTFVFLGATPDAWDVGMGMGVQRGNSVQYNQAQAPAVFAATAAATNVFARSAARVVDALYRRTGVESDAIKQQPEEQGKS